MVRCSVTLLVQCVEKHLIVFGRVQGVGFRAWTKRQAEDLGLEGWVRNNSDGTVETKFRGGRAEVARFELLLHQGPKFAQVSSIRPVGEDSEMLEISAGTFVILKNEAL